MSAIRAGYKQTEVGVIPADWEIKALGECLLGKPRYGINSSAVPFSDRLPTYIRITDITDDGRFSKDKQASVDSQESSNYYLCNGDIVFARTGASVGKSYRYLPSDGPLVFAGFLMQIRPDEQKLIPTYVAAYAHTGGYWNWVRLMSMRSGQPGINGKELSQLPIPVPPLSEQEAIAGALSDADALIESLEQLLAKKHHLKQGTMQELLTGKKRLPGFSGEWGVKPLSALCRMKSGEAITSDDIDDCSDFPCFGGNGLRGFTKSYNHEGDFALVGRQGALCGNVLVATGKFFASEHAIVVTPNRDTDVFWLACVLTRMGLNQYSESSAQPGLSVSKLLLLECEVPSHAEQTAIAAALSDIDAEIAELESELTKTRALKQGMMQKLLTGEIRLI